MRRISIIPAAAATLALVACAGPAPVASSSSAITVAVADRADTTAAVTVLQRTLSDALDAAKAYGRSNLGHYRKLTHRALDAQGFRPAPDVRLRVYVSHTDYCLAATHTGLPADSRWRIASIDSRRQQPAPGDGCATLLGAKGIASATASTVRSDRGGWICRLPTVGA